MSSEIWDAAEQIRNKRAQNRVLENDILDIVLSYVGESVNNDDNVRKRQQIDKDISALESRKSRMTDMLIDGTITKEVIDEKMLLRKNRKKLRNQKKESRCHKMKKLAEVVNKSVSMEKNSIEKMCIEPSIVVFKYTHFIFAYDSICGAHVNRRSHRLRLIPLPCRVKSYPKYKAGC